jgi:transposase
LSWYSRVLGFGPAVSYKTLERSYSDIMVMAILNEVFFLT